MESRCIVVGRGFRLDSFVEENVVEIVEGKARDVSAEKRLALKKLALDFLDMAPGSECLPVSVLLVALDARRRARCAAGVL